jgi:diaminopimelate epimerase
MGNPHCVVFADPDRTDIETLGYKFEHSPIFPERVNTEFVRVMARNRLKMRVWERGSGETWACGTGACATAVAAVLNGFADKNEEILVHLRGGDLKITYTDETVFMEGGATLAFVGEVEI